MKKLLFSLILSLLPIASSAIQYEYFNPLMKSNAAVKVNETVGVLTPPEGKGFGILSALTNLQSVNSSIATDEYGIQVDTLGLVCPTEEAVAAAISDHNSSETAHSFIQNKVAVNTAAIDANADAIQKTRDDMNEEDGRLQTQITAHAGAITALQNEQTATGNQIQTIESKIPDGTSDTNPLINKQQFLDEEMDIREDLNESVSELQTQITAQATAIAGKQDELIAGDNITIVDNVISATGGGGGSGDYLPLSGGTVNGVVKIQNGQGTGSLWVGADVNNTTLTNNQRHLARIVVPSYSNVERGATLLGWDSSGDTNVHIANNSADMVGFGGSKKITNATSPMGISFCVAKTREATAAADKVYPLAMDANAANFDVPVDVPELTVGTDDGTLNLSITAGVATIATNNGLDIISQTKFDTLPTTDDTTTWANALDANLVSKAQVASALSELPTGANLPILTSIWTDHLLNDMSWLRADTFSWHSGDVYNAAYDHLSSEYKDLYIVASGGTLGEEDLYYRDSSKDTDSLYAWVSNSDIVIYTRVITPTTGDTTVSATGLPTGIITESTSKSDTVGDITITYYQAEDGHKICLPDQESNIVSLYNNTGSANYYILDTTNKQFKLPRKQKRTLVRTVKNDNYTWYNLYSDGWVEQGGFLPDTWSGSKTFTFPVAMADSNYTLTTSSGTPNIGGMHGKDYVTARSATSFTYSSSSVSGNFTTKNFSWLVEGYASASAYADVGVRLEYYFVGNFEQSAVEQTAGITSETLNNKADIDLGNIPANYDYVVESQLPTAENNYTWYRKYKSGWVEQGGEITTSGVVTLPIEMSNTHYTATQGIKYTTSSQWSIGSIRPASTTSVSVNKANGDASWWQVSGMSAQ